MPFGIRTRLAIVGALAMMLAVAIYAALVSSRERLNEQAERYRSERVAVQERAESLAVLIRVEYGRGEELTTNESAERPPVATAALRAIVEDVSGFVWVLDRFSAGVYSSNAVRALPENDRSMLDSIVASIEPGGTVAGNDSVGFGIASLPDATVRKLSFHGSDLILYSVGSTFRVTGVNRVVVGKLVEPPVDLLVPYFIMIPMVLAISAAVAVTARAITLRPIEVRITTLINEVEAISDGRSLHRRLPTVEGGSDEVARLAATLNEMIGRLEQSFSGLRRFTADASHELKTPLTVLRADVERAMATQSDRREQLVALEEALAETARMADLVDSLLTLARADEGRFDLHREAVDLEAFVQDIYETAVLLGEGANVSVSMAPPPKVQVQGDSARLRQLFLNLVTNAIKYTPGGGKVELSLTSSDSVASFSVRDSGIGIAAADLPHVFERFWRADQARSRVGERGGFGLGLAISQYIAQAHGGSLTVQSRLGRGSTFTVALPTDRPADSPPKA